jgi:aspartyl-tRNA synthetase
MTSLLPVTPCIDYVLLGNAQAYYQTLGYQELAVPWIISHEAQNAMRPPDRREFFTLDGYLNSSGEQSFLELLLAGKALTKHCCITSCFRDEAPDSLHQRYFVKLELINTDATEANLQAMLYDAKTFFDQISPKEYQTSIVTTDSIAPTYDIVDGRNGIELGSYGIRTYKSHRWIYGTGLALPRFSIALNHDPNPART